ncbi:MAG: sugar ABC transporter ATP-binding protein [Candidatus Aerophobus sp.]|nr:MAG: sugar ABC transporter ATP-binding protein [Candidatus Aerophobus sp.]
MEPLLEVKNITKRFGGLTAVDNMDMEVFPGEVVGLLGDNGAGKSTLIKVISGVYHADAGTIFFEGKEVRIDNPMDALGIGIETLYQDLALAENLNVYANIFLGREKLKRFLGLINVLDHDYMLNESKKVLDRLEIEVPSLKNQIRTLSGGQRQAVAISRSIYWNAKFLIMDEPTAALGVAEQKNVLDLVKTLSSQGVPVIIISHQLHDVFSVATRLVIMRRGKKVAERITKDTTTDEIVGLIVGSLPGDYGDVNDGAKETAQVGKETGSVDKGQEGKQ